MGDSDVIQAFGRYELLQILGAGGMAQVHLARQVGPSGFVKPCVLKRISSEHVHDPRIRRMFLEEARISALMNHPHIVQTFDFGEVDQVPYMALELVDGVNLSELCRAIADSGHWFPLRIALEIGHAVLDALSYAHTLKGLDGKRLNIVHRDVSPQNILVSRQGGVKLADFGIARHEAREEHTRAEGGKGKPGYMPPEQGMGGDIDGRADLFALGIVITELMSARRVRVPGASQGLRDLSERILSLINLRRDIDPDLRTFILRMTDLEVSSRPATARIASDMLRPIIDKMPVQESLSQFLENVLARFFPADQVLIPGTCDMSSEIPAIDPDSDKVPQAVSEASKEVYSLWPKMELEEKAPQPLPQAPVPPSPVPKLRIPSPSGPNAAAKHPARAFSNPGLGPETNAAEMIAQAVQMAPAPIATQEKLLKKARIYGPLVGVGAVMALAAFGIVALVSRGASIHESKTKLELGTILVDSQPRGAQIYLEGVSIGQETPASLINVAFNRAQRIAVVMRNHRSYPKEINLTLSSDDPHARAYFDLKAGRTFRVESTPSGASVTLDGQPLSSLTPMELPVIPFGQTASLTLNLEGHLATKLVLRASTQTATLTSVRLDAAQPGDIVSEPSHALAYVDGHLLGFTPQYEVELPSSRSFRLRITKKGFATWNKMIWLSRIGGKQIQADLKPLPLLELPMSKEDFVEARTLDHKNSRVSVDLRRAHATLVQVERRLAQIQRSPNIFIGRVTSLETAVDKTKQKIEDLENEQQEVESQLVEFRQRVMSKVDPDAELQ